MATGARAGWWQWLRAAAPSGGSARLFGQSPASATPLLTAVAPATVATADAAEPVEPVLAVRELAAFYGARRAIDGITLDIPVRAVTALIGPSGCGKTTLLRCLNRMHDLAGGSITGGILLDGRNIYAPGTDVVALRRRVGA